MNVSQYFPVKLYIYYKKDKRCQGKSVFVNSSDTINNTSEYNLSIIKLDVSLCVYTEVYYVFCTKNLLIPIVKYCWKKTNRKLTPHYQ